MSQLNNETMSNSLCKHCGTELIVKETKRTSEQLKKSYYYTAYYSCPRCGRLYHDEKFKIINNNIDLFKDNILNEEPIDIDVELWTDGACVNNGRDNAKAAWAFVSGSFEKAGFVDGKQTNNRAEAQAILEALKWAREKGYKRVKIYSDSQITLHNLNKSPEKIKLNREIFENIFKIIQGEKMSIVYEKVTGHSGVENNERADVLANGLAAG
jgi:ribonuclease HI